MNEVSVNLEGTLSIDLYFDGLLKMFVNDELRRRYDRDVHPEMWRDAIETEADAIRIATEYRSIVLGERTSKIGMQESPEVHRYPAVLDRGEYGVYGSLHPEQFNIIWRRTHNGYVFHKDIFKVHLYSTGELECVVDNLDSQTCPTEVKISRDKALDIASKAAREIDRTHSAFTYRSAIIGEVWECKLLIVNPNWIFPPRNESVFAYTLNKEARLAYQVRFMLRSKEDPTWEGVKDLVVIWVDAATGEILGGGEPG